MYMLLDCDNIFNIDCTILDTEYVCTTFRYITCITKGPVIIYDQGGSESNDFLWKIFSRPTRRAEIWQPTRHRAKNF